MKLAGKCTVIFDCIIDFMAILAGILLMLVLIGVTVGVAVRYFLGISLFYVVEISAYSLLYICFLVAPWVLKKEEHVKLDLVINHLDERINSLIGIITSIAGAIVFSIIAWYGTKATWGLFQSGYFVPSILAPPKYIIVGIIPLSCLLLTIQFIRRAWDFARNRRTT